METRLFQDLRVIDFHAHFGIRQDAAVQSAAPAYEPGTPAHRAAEDRERQVARYQQQWRLAWNFPEPAGERLSWEEEADRWKRELERHRIERIVFVTGGGNDQLAKVVARHSGEFLGFAHHDPFQPGAAEELERSVTTLGLRGYKLLAPRLSQPIDHPSGYATWDVAARHGIPVLIHFGMLGAGGGIAFNDRINPALLESVARRFPTVNFVIPHFGIQYVTELLFLCWACPNVHVDTSGSNQWVRWMPYPLTLELLFRKFLETIGPERIIFGSDSSWFPRGFVLRYLEEQVRICRFLGLRDADLQAIFGGNAARLLGIER